MAIGFQRNMGMLVLAIWLILYGLSGFIALGLPSPLMAILALIAGDLAGEISLPDLPRHSILELAGLGKEIWEGIDAQEYVNKLRGGWDESAQ